MLTEVFNALGYQSSNYIRSREGLSADWRIDNQGSKCYQRIRNFHFSENCTKVLYSQWDNRVFNTLSQRSSFFVFNFQKILSIEDFYLRPINLFQGMTQHRFNFDVGIFLTLLNDPIR